MKTIHAYIDNSEVIIDPNTPIDFELNEHPAYKNWDKLRSLGWANCYLLNEERTKYLHWHFPENDYDQLELEIATYDWYYEMSDDMRVWRDGQAKDNRIRNLSSKVGKEKYLTIWNSYVQKASTRYAKPEEFLSRYMIPEKSMK